jgi:hypothetical protein
MYEIVEALEVLTQGNEDETDARAVEYTAKTNRIRAFLAAEGLSDVLAAIRDGADFAADMNDGSEFDATADRLRLISRDVSRALGRVQP